ncbi:hypothetical protein ACQPUY_07310 [Clostridium nigeriense]|uniref:hypothetical protein n=1 Tax=Clostridium nigeriense TaxID=1805470 RepID=UPI003D325513
MEIEYKNSIGDIEFLIKYWNLKLGFTKYKYVISSIGIISGIYYSITLKTPLYIFTNTIIMTGIVFFFLKKREIYYLNRISKRDARKYCRKDEYFTAEKTLTLDKDSLIINCINDRIEINLNNPFIGVYVVDNYVIIVPKSLYSYKSKIIIPNNAFKSEDEKNNFINYIKNKILNSKIKNIILKRKELKN